MGPDDVLCDLDGVVYRGRSALPGASEALRRLEEEGLRLWFVTNNSTRSPEHTAEKLAQIVGIEIDPKRIFTSAQASAHMLGVEDGPVYVVGLDGLVQAVVDVGFDVTDDHEEARTVLVGLDRRLTYDTIAAAAEAVRRGARFIASNRDPTFPTATGLLPGAGSIVAAIATAAGREPEVAGKPHPPMRELIKRSGVAEAWVIGDRMDTDVALAANEPGWRSVLVLTGVTTDSDDTTKADHVVPDIFSAVDLVLRESRGR